MTWAVRLRLGLDGLAEVAKVIGADRSALVSAAIVHTEVTEHGQRPAVGVLDGQNRELRVHRVRQVR